MIHQTNTKIIGIIPSRYQSSRFPGKPLVTVAGKTLIRHTYENARKCSLIDELIVATDDQRIFEHVKAFGGKVVMTSPKHLTGSDRLVEVLEKEPTEANLIINIQGDEPLIEKEVIEKTIIALRDDPESVVSTAVIPLKSEEAAREYSTVKCVIDDNHRALYFSRALIPSNKQGTFDSNTTYYHHVGIYCYRPNFLLKYAKLPPTPLQQAECLEQLKIIEHGYSIKVAIVNSQSIGVDTPQDLKKVEALLWDQNTSS